MSPRSHRLKHPRYSPQAPQDLLRILPQCPLRELQYLLRILLQRPLQVHPDPRKRHILRQVPQESYPRNPRMSPQYHRLKHPRYSPQAPLCLPRILPQYPLRAPQDLLQILPQCPLRELQYLLRTLPQRPLRKLQYLLRILLQTPLWVRPDPRKHHIPRQIPRGNFPRSPLKSPQCHRLNHPRYSPQAPLCLPRILPQTPLWVRPDPRKRHILRQIPRENFPRSPRIPLQVLQKPRREMNHLPRTAYHRNQVSEAHLRIQPRNLRQPGIPRPEKPLLRPKHFRFRIRQQALPRRIILRRRQADPLRKNRKVPAQGSQNRRFARHHRV